MDFLSRRTIRKYEEKKISSAEIDEIMKLAVVAPSGRNLRACEFIVVSEKNILEGLANCKAAGAQMIPGSSHAVVILGLESISDTWTEDCSIAATLIQVKAWGMGIGSCWVQMKNRTDKNGEHSEELIRKLLNIPKDRRVLCIVSLGYPGESKEGYSEKDLNMERVHYEKY